MYQPFHKLRVRFAELEMKQGEVAKRANMAESTLTARMTGRLPWNGDEIARVAKVLDLHLQRHVHQRRQQARCRGSDCREHL